MEMQTEQKTRKDDTDTIPRREAKGRNFEAGAGVRIAEGNQGWGFGTQAAWGQHGYPSAQGGPFQQGFQAFPNQGFQPYGPQAQPGSIGMGFPNPFAAVAPTLSYGLAGLADLVYRGVALATAQGQSLLTSIQAPGRSMALQGSVAWPQARLPPTDIVDEGAELVCQLELPGVKPENVDVACHGRGIVVTARAEPEIDLGALVQAERGLQATYRRAIPLPVPVQPSGAKARLREGILTINVPKADPTEGPRRVNVE